MFRKKKKPNPYKEANEAFLQVKAQEEGKAQKADSRRRMGTLAVQVSDPGGAGRGA